MRPGIMLAAVHDARAIVLPAPGGPVTTVTGPPAPSARRWSRRGRGTIHPGKRGAVSLDAKTRSSACRVCGRLAVCAIIYPCSQQYATASALIQCADRLGGEVPAADSLTLFESARGVPTLLRVIPSLERARVMAASGRGGTAPQPEMVQSRRRSTARSMASERDATPSFW